MKIRLAITITAILLTAGLSAVCQTIAKDELTKTQTALQKQGKKYNWELFDTTSTVSLNNISLESIQGDWKSYNGVFKFGDVVNSMSLTVPIIFELKDKKSRRNKDSKFEEVTLNSNQIIFKAENDIGIINKITDNLLVITWKRGGNYTRYYYEK